jgi:Ran GTPase-activating protein (RanGAP) involved in mRNA processing and transport
LPAQIADIADMLTGQLINEISLALGALCDAVKSHTSLYKLNSSDHTFGARSIDCIVSSSRITKALPSSS